MGMEPAIRLVPLRVPAGWAVRFNHFVEAEPPALGRPDPEWPQGDLLCIEQVPADGESAPWWMGLSWIERDGGYFRLLLRRDGSDRIFKRFVARDREEVRITLESWLDTLSATRDDRALRRCVGF
jgi:hypothetical protein